MRCDMYNKLLTSQKSTRPKYWRQCTIFCTSLYLRVCLFDFLSLILLCCDPIGRAFCIDGRYLSVRLSLCPVPDPKSRTERWNLAQRKTMKHVTRDPVYRSEGQGSRSPGRLTPWPNVNHICGTGKPTRFKLGVRMEYRITDLQTERCGWMFKLLFAPYTGRGHILAAPRQF